MGRSKSQLLRTSASRTFAIAFLFLQLLVTPYAYASSCYGALTRFEENEKANHRKFDSAKCGAYLLEQYQGDLYTAVNRYLRGDKRSPDRCDEVVEIMSRRLLDLPLGESHVWRGSKLPITILNSLTVGAIFKDEAFLSTSPNKKIVTNFVGNALFEIFGRTGRALRNNGESEVLFLPRTTFRVMERKSVFYDVHTGEYSSKYKLGDYPITYLKLSSGFVSTQAMSPYSDNRFAF